MSITSISYKQIGRMNIIGRFDFSVHREFKQAYMAMLVNPAVLEIEVNLQNTDFIDSSALGMLMLLKERAKAANMNVFLSNPAGSVAKLLEVANFDKLFVIKGVIPAAGYAEEEAVA